jgi:hypothetical protein
MTQENLQIIPIWRRVTSIKYEYRISKCETMSNYPNSKTAKFGFLHDIALNIGSFVIRIYFEFRISSFGFSDFYKNDLVFF